MMTEPTSDPTRSCVGCREKDARDVLLRFVAVEMDSSVGGNSPVASAGDTPPVASAGGVPEVVVKPPRPVASKILVPDVRRRSGGRGVSVHARYRCLEAAVRNGSLKRAFRGEVDPSARELARAARMQYERRAEGLVMAARRSRLLASGTEAVREAITTRKAQLLVVAHDAEGSREDLEEAARRLGRACLVWNSKEGLGRLFSRSTLSVLAILDHGIADELRSVVRSAAELAEDA